MRGKYKSFYAMCKNGVHATTTYDAHGFGFLYLSPMAKKLRTGEGIDEKKIPAAGQLLSTKNFALPYPFYMSFWAKALVWLAIVVNSKSVYLLQESPW